MKVTPGPKVFYILSGLVVAIGGVATYLGYSQVDEQHMKLENRRKEVRKEADVKKELEESTAKITQLQQQLKHLEEGVPSFAYIPTMLKELEVVGSSNGIDVLGVRPAIAPPPKGEKAEKKNPYEEQLINVKGRGNFRNVLNFVDSLNRFPKIVAVRMLNIVPKVDPAKPLESPKLEVEIELKAYAFKDSDPSKKSEKTTTTAQRTLVGGKA